MPIELRDVFGAQLGLHRSGLMCRPGVGVMRDGRFAIHDLLLAECFAV
jgi:hypothetical protein